MINDLISREYVKLFVCEYEKFNGKETEIVKAVPIIAIDNAPTVTPSLNLDNLTEDDVEKFKMIWQRATSKGLLVTIEERPRGEWIDRMADKGYVECPFCHKQITGGDLNFCVKCGADMRGEEKETKNED